MRIDSSEAAMILETALVMFSITLEFACTVATKTNQTSIISQSLPESAWMDLQ
jgi:hypothetical protein